MPSVARGRGIDSTAVRAGRLGSGAGKEAVTVGVAAEIPTVPAARSGEAAGATGNVGVRLPVVPASSRSPLRSYARMDARPTGTYTRLNGSIVASE